jgi:hypothetical protein
VGDTRVGAHMKRRDFVTSLVAAFALSRRVLGRMVCLWAILNILGGLAYAKTETVFCEYKYVMGDNDTKHDAKKIAFIEAKRICVEKIGTFLESETIVSSARLTKDEVKAYALGLIKTDIASEDVSPSGENMSVLVKIKVEYDSAAMAAKLQELMSDRGKLREFKKAQEQIVSLENQVITLQKELSQAKTEGEISQLRQERKATLQQYKLIEAKIENLTTSAIEQIKQGMTENEIVQLVGKPRSKSDCGTSKEGLNYGKIWAVLEDGITVGYIPLEHWTGLCGDIWRRNLRKF